MRQDSYIQQIYERICDAKPQTAFVILDFCDLTDYDTANSSTTPGFWFLQHVLC